ncbi:MAG: SDR family oxidoreductase [Alphaproteobacteria bacterium]|nr:SDR family oxidoreductase [Alphaproteobacteria bacterium]
MIALVTGAGRGLGLEFARQLAARGATVFGTVRRDGEALDALGVTALRLDVADPASIAAFATDLAARVDRVDLLINNAGINSRGVPEGQRNVRWGALEPEGILRMVQVNAVGPVLVTQALAPLLKPGARVLSISSWLGSIQRKTSGGNYGYCASKTTLNMLARAMAFDLAEQGVISVVANPGWVRTDMGGARAALTPDQSVSGLLALVDQLTPAHTGGFYQWDGTEHPW